MNLFSGKMTWEGVFKTTSVVATIAASVWVLSAKVTNLTNEIKLMRQDICQYAIPESARPFAFSCRETHSGLQAQEPPLTFDWK